MRSLLVTAEAVDARRADARGEPRRAHAHRLRGRARRVGEGQHRDLARGRTARWRREASSARRRRTSCARSPTRRSRTSRPASQVGRRRWRCVTWPRESAATRAVADRRRRPKATRTFRVWRGDASGGEFVDYEVADRARHGRARRAPSHPGAPGERPRGALELQGRQVRLVQHGDQRQAEALVHDAHERLRPGRDDHRPAAEDVPGDQGPGHRRLLELRAEQAHPAVHAAPARRRRQVPDVPGGRRSRAGVPQVHRVLPVPGRLPRAARPRQARTSSSARAS